MKFCSHCGHTLIRQIPPDDQHLRDCCLQCGMVHYINPKVVVGTVPVWEDRILLCRRAIEPRRGYWTLPAGFLECNESTAQGALRETWEEAGAQITLGTLCAMIDIPHIDQVHLFFYASLQHLDFAPGPESLDVALFHPNDIPWDDLAFRSVISTLEHYLRSGCHTNALHHVTLEATQVAEDAAPRTAP